MRKSFLDLVSTYEVDKVPEELRNFYFERSRHQRALNHGGSMRTAMTVPSRALWKWLWRGGQAEITCECHFFTCAATQSN
jgi:hypothetical protein